MLSSVDQPPLPSVAPMLHDTWRLPADQLGNEIVLYCDAARISQVLANVLNNAARYTPPLGRIRLEVGGDAQDDCKRSDQIEIRVIDLEP